MSQPFTWSDCFTVISKDWGLAIIALIFKNGCKLDPRNYCPISLLSIISKLYVRYLLEKRHDWLHEGNVLSEEQAGFRVGRATIDQALVLQCLKEALYMWPS